LNMIPPLVVLEQIVRSLAMTLSRYRLSGLKTIPVSVVNTSPARDEIRAGMKSLAERPSS
jgi:hypothetical protein